MKLDKLLNRFDNEAGVHQENLPTHLSLAFSEKYSQDIFSVLDLFFPDRSFLNKQLTENSGMLIQSGISK
jgi:hypothetical protein